MQFTRYTDTDLFAADAVDVLMADEVQNGLPLNFVGKRLVENTDFLRYIPENWIL